MSLESIAPQHLVKEIRNRSLSFRLLHRVENDETESSRPPSRDLTLLRLNNFDFIRVALAILVIFSHSFPLGTGSELFEPFALFTRKQTTGGAIAVNLFFAISGFLITHSFLHSKNFGSYLSKRIRRIYPGFIALALISAVVFCRGHVSVGNFVWQTARLQEFQHPPVFPGNPYPGVLNGSLWSIQYEFWCYLGVAFLGLTGLLRRRNLIVLLFGVALALSVLFRLFNWKLSGGPIGYIFGYPPFWARLLPLYLVGVVFYLFRERIFLTGKGAVLAITALVVSALVSPLWTLVFPVAGMYLTLWVAFHPKIRLSRFARFGDVSYGTYLYAFPIQQTTMRFIGHAAHPLLLFALATPLTLAAAFVSWHGVERWFVQPRRTSPTATKPMKAQAASAGQ